MGSRGRVAVALTTARMLAVTPYSGSWQEERYRLVEAPVAEAYLSQTLALVVTAAARAGVLRHRQLDRGDPRPPRGRDRR